MGALFGNSVNEGWQWVLLGVIAFMCDGDGCFYGVSVHE